MKKLIIRIAMGAVLDALIAYATKQRDEGGHTIEHKNRWMNIISFLVNMKETGLPL